MVQDPGADDPFDLLVTGSVRAVTEGVRQGGIGTTELSDTPQPGATLPPLAVKLGAALVR
jgi:hypothetical protein